MARIKSKPKKKSLRVTMHLDSSRLAGFPSNQVETQPHPEDRSSPTYGLFKPKAPSAKVVEGILTIPLSSRGPLPSNSNIDRAPRAQLSKANLLQHTDGHMGQPERNPHMNGGPAERSQYRPTLQYGYNNLAEFQAAAARAGWGFGQVPQPPREFISAAVHAALPSTVPVSAYRSQVDLPDPARAPSRAGKITKNTSSRQFPSPVSSDTVGRHSTSATVPVTRRIVGAQYPPNRSQGPRVPPIVGDSTCKIENGVVSFPGSERTIIPHSHRKQSPCEERPQMEVVDKGAGHEDAQSGYFDEAFDAIMSARTYQRSREFK